MQKFLMLGLLLAGGVVAGACSSSSGGGGGVPCDEAGACANGFVCSQGTCVQAGNGGSGGGATCDEGGSCPAGWVCSQGACVPSNGGSGGTTGGTGGLPSGGTGGDGGAPPVGGAGGGPSCDSVTGTPGDCGGDSGNICQDCIALSCCTEYGNCIQTPEDNCGWGGPNGDGEIICFQECVLSAGTADPTTQASCAGSCATPGCNTITSFTNDLIACLNNSCFAECLQP